MFKTCKHCGIEFNLHSRHKKMVGGYINECPDCVEERGGDQSPPKYLGVTSGNGKMCDVTILKFEDEASRNSFQKAWRNNVGQNLGKECQIGKHTSMTGGLKSKIVSENRGNDNHKGKL